MNELFLAVPVMILIAVVLSVMALGSPRETTMQARLRAYGYDLKERPGGDLTAPFTVRVLAPAARGIARFVYKMTPAGVVSGSREKLRKAHVSIGLGPFLALRLVIAVVLPGLYLVGVAIRGRVSLLDWAIAIFLMYLGHRLPDIWLSLRIDGRSGEITRSLPDALDLIVVCVEAGYGLEAAIAKVVEATKGPLADEFNQMLAEVALGQSRREAMRALSERSGSSDLQTFIAAILQADQMGVNIANALRVQADSMRVRRRQRAEELIAKAPVKMLFPLVALIFPALFVVLLGPALMKIYAMFATVAR